MTTEVELGMQIRIGTIVIGFFSIFVRKRPKALLCLVLKSIPTTNQFESLTFAGPSRTSIFFNSVWFFKLRTNLKISTSITVLHSSIETRFSKHSHCNKLRHTAACRIYTLKVPQNLFWCCIEVQMNEKYWGIKWIRWAAQYQICQRCTWHQIQHYGVLKQLIKRFPPQGPLQKLSPFVSHCISFRLPDLDSSKEESRIRKKFDISWLHTLVIRFRGFLTRQ